LRALVREGRRPVSSAVAKVFLFLLLSLGAFLWVGYSVTELTGGGQRVAVGAVEITPEGGEAVFWGKGRCFTCHSVGDRGSAVRGPNQGQFGEKFTEPIGVRAAARAAERAEKTGEEYTATDYLIESLASPGAYVVKGYKNEMAVVYAPPISLGLDEVKAVITYLQSQGGEPDPEALDNPSEGSTPRSRPPRRPAAATPRPAPRSTRTTAWTATWLARMAAIWGPSSRPSPARG
jgi:hypothetical protein